MNETGKKSREETQNRAYIFTLLSLPSLLFTANSGYWPAVVVDVVVVVVAIGAVAAVVCEAY